VVLVAFHHFFAEPVSDPSYPKVERGIAEKEVSHFNKSGNLQFLFLVSCLVFGSIVL